MPAWYVLGIFIPFIRNRLFFELKRQEVDTLHADMAFEVSSQGELEQVFPIINHFLKSGAVIQVIYSSPSLNNEIEKLARDWKGQFFWLRMPIFTYFPLKTPLTSNVWSWLKATRLDFCRYDFFPELVLIAAKRSARLYSGTLKNKNIKGFMGFYFEGIYSLFDRIYCASPVDKGRFLELNQAQEVFFYDFRQIQILRRLEQKNITLNPLTMFINDVPKDSLLMMGSCWPNEMSVFADSNFRDELKSGKITLILAPHKLNTGFIDEIISSAKIHFPDFDPTIIQKNGEIIYGKQSNVIVTLLAGVLCEAYSLVKHTFVGEVMGEVFTVFLSHG